MRGSNLDRTAGYRRGTVMGLTVAEAFMLISFVLLMLLGVWMATARDRIAALEERVRVAEQFAGSFTEEQKAAAIAARDQLTLLGQDLLKLDGFRDILEGGATAAEAAQALELLPALAEGHTADELLTRARLLDEALLEELAQAAADLPIEEQRTLTDLARLEDFPEAIAALQARGPAALSEDLADLEAYRATGLDAATISRLDATLGEVEAARLQASRSRADIAAAILRRTGPVVADLGGEVRADGSIVFRDRLLFEAGSARLTPAFDAALTRLCRPWIETLHEQRDGLSAVRIEGHASSEWTGEARDGAFARNLDLSQARAAAVFKRCLVLAGDDGIAEWARTRMSAVGFSSSRPVLSDGIEDRAASRRVVFAIDAQSPDMAMERALGASN